MEKTDLSHSTHLQKRSSQWRIAHYVRQRLELLGPDLLYPVFLSARLRILSHQIRSFVATHHFDPE